MKIHQEELTIGQDFTYWLKQYNQVQFTSPRHYHFQYELAYIKTGEGKLYIGNTIYKFKAGDLFLFAPSLIHAFKNTPSPNLEYASCRIILFNHDFLGENFLMRQECMPLRRMLEEAKEGLHFIDPDLRIIQKMEQLPDQVTLESVSLFLNLLDVLTKHEGRKTLTNKWFRKSYYIRDQEKTLRLLYYIHANLSDISFKKAANFAGLGDSSFARMFKSKTERTFSEYLNEARIKRSQELLIETSTPIRDISEECGFKNLSYFNRVFKKINKKTPLQYRQTFQY